MSNKIFRMLIIEDEEEISTLIREVMIKFNPKVDIVIASNKFDAITIIENEGEFFDLISLDLQIPTNVGLMDKAAEHGLSILPIAQEYLPGTPIVMLTGTSTVQMINDFLQFSNTIDIWQNGIKSSSIQHFDKSQLNKYIECVQKMCNSTLNLFNVELNYQGNDLLPIEYDRLIRIFTLRLKGVRVNVKKVSGGLSSSKVYSLAIFDSNGNLSYQTIAKCGDSIEIREDSSNYMTFIHRLNESVTPRKLDHIKYGAKCKSGVFYGFAEQYTYSYFQTSLTNLNNTEIRTSIKDLTKEWQLAGTVKTTDIKYIRKKLVSDEIAFKLWKDYDLKWAEEFENNQIQIKEGICHCDLHGENILINIDNKSSTLIDYGDIKEISMTIDPLTLECSFLFHPNGIDNKMWATLEEDIENWQNIDEYIKNSPIKDEIIFCREWLNSVKIANREVGASLYSYALRQLKYDNTNKKIALKLLNVAKNIIESLT